MSQYDKIKARNTRQRQYYSEAAKAINYKKHENTSQMKFLPHEPIIDHYGTIHENIKHLTSLLEEPLNDQRKRQAREEDYKIKLHFLKSQHQVDDTYHAISRKLSNSVTEGAWLDKEITKLQKKISRIRKGQGFSRVACAFMAFDINTSREPNSSIANTSSSIAPTNSDDSNGINNVNNGSNQAITTARPTLQTAADDTLSLSNVSVDAERLRLRDDLDRMQDETGQLLASLSAERELLKKDKESHEIELRCAIMTSKANQDKLRLELQQQLRDQTSLIEKLNSMPANAKQTSISSPVKQLLTNYDTLDDDSKKNLFQMAMLTNNEPLQRAIIDLQQMKGKNSSSSQAKLAKELTKLAQTYKVSELVFDTRATKRRTNYFLWSTKLHPILAMFPQSSRCLTQSTLHLMMMQNVLAAKPYIC
jgi:hypothetical protein